MFTNSQSYRSIRFLISHVYRTCKYRNEDELFRRFPYTVYDPQKNVARFNHDDEKSGRRSHKYDYVLNMTNSQYLDHIYQSWKKDPKSVSPSWDSYFKLIYSDDLVPSNPSTNPSPEPMVVRVESSITMVPGNLSGLQPTGAPFYRL